MPPPPQGDSTNTKQLIVERVRQSTNILVAVSADPSVDSLAAALALALVLNKLDKHTTAVFSGQMPAVMQFLNPEKTFENNVDSLRDFIISLDKEKADRLRYKLEKDVVRIFITPYRTTISEKDLQFSQGDFNVDLIIALGVEKREELDKAIVAHGRILHDAAVVTINANNQQSTLGAVDWHDPNASSLCEMLVSLTEALQKPGLLDAQIATALLTGIVASTERFSNQHTTPRVMTMAAQLMAAGANQQLVATNIQAAHQPIPEVTEPDTPADSIVDENGDLAIRHEPEPAKDTAPKKEPKPKDTKAAEKELEDALPNIVQPPDTQVLEDLTAELEHAVPTPEPEPEPEPEPAVPPPNRGFISEPPKIEQEEPLIATGEVKPPEDKPDKSSWQGRRIEPLTAPSLGGSLSATSEEALEDKVRTEESKRNHQLLSHGEEQGGGGQTLTHGAPGVSPAGDEEPPTLMPAPEPPSGGVDTARQAVDSALASQPFDPSRQPTQSVGAQSIPSAPDVQPYIPIEPPAAMQPPHAPAEESHNLPTDSNGLPIIPPMPSLPTQEPGGMQVPPMPPPLPPLPGEPEAPASPPADAGQPTDPGQFKIPS